MAGTKITFDASGMMNRAQEAFLQVSREIEEISRDGLPCVDLDEEDERLWDAEDEVERERNRRDIIAAVVGEAKANSCTALLVQSAAEQTALAIVRQDDDGEWRIRFLEDLMRISMTDDDDAPVLPELALRFNGTPGFYQICPDGTVVDLDDEPELWGVWQDVDVNEKAILRIRLHGDESNGPINEPAMKIVRGHDISSMLPGLEEDEGSLVIYGDAYVQEFDD